ncbi:DMT family transporter [Kiloniella laminariae]|uniref:DMT family transporter n=1 Tax=Kiloniella laminariae TaxID=454162 RepID=UPI00037378EB|nr:DMT family transporter [Kiloniella laminariae]
MSKQLTSAVNTSGDRIFLGIILAIVMVFCMSVMDGIAKWLTASYSLISIILIRNTFSLPLTVALVIKSGGWQTLRCDRPWLLLARSALIIVTAGSFYAALPLMPLAEAFAITFVGPLFITILSVIFLGEKVGPHRWGVVFTGFCGVLVIFQPGTDAFQPAAFLPLIAAFFYAVLMIITRQLRHHSTSAGITFWGTLTTVILALVALLLPWDAFAWTRPDNSDLLMILVMAIVATTAHFLTSQAYRIAPAAVIAPFEYTILLWGLLFGWFFWNEIPEAHVLIGAAVIVASGLYLIYRESRSMRKTVLDSRLPENSRHPTA